MAQKKIKLAAAKEPVFTGSKEYQNANQQLSAHLKTQPKDYKSGYQSDIDKVLDSILSGESFSYHYGDDPLYQLYREKYTKKGKLAMQDAMGDAAAQTGGYGSSYAATAGSGAYQQSLDELNEQLPALAANAYSRYQDKRGEQYNQLGALQSAESTAYGIYRDQVSDYYTDRDYYYSKAGDLYDRDFSRYQQAYEQWNDNRNFNQAVRSEELRSDVEKQKFLLEKEYLLTK